MSKRGAFAYEWTNVVIVALSKDRDASSPLRGCALITGGTSGIGLAFAEGLAARGLDLVLVARSSERLDETKARLESRFSISCETLVADLSTNAGVVAVSQRLDSPTEPIEVFINNAGQGFYHGLATREFEPAAAAINLMGTTVVSLGGAAAETMKRRGHGVIVNTASVSGLVPMGLYSGIKAMVKTWSLSLAIEMKASGVQVVALMPGWVRTEFHERAGVARSNLPDFMWLTPQRVVADCLSDIDKGKVYSVPSKRFKIIGGFVERAPKKIVWAITAKINKGRN